MPLVAIAYVEILDKGNRSVLQAKIGLKEGDGNGSIYLPVTLNSGNYKLRAYTNWMKNFSPDYFFEKPITIINSQKIPDAPPAQQQLNMILDFSRKVAIWLPAFKANVHFRIVDQYGRGVDCEGILIDNNNDTILKFRPVKFGIGNFNFTPAPNHSYKALIKFPDGKIETRDLPMAYDKGYTMNLSVVRNDQVQISVKQATPGNEVVYLFVHTRGSIKSVQEVEAEKWCGEFFN